MSNYITDTIKVGDKIYEATQSLCGDGGGTVELETANVVPSLQEQVILPSEGKYIDKVNVEAVNNNIDSEIKSENIKSGISILGVEGTLIPSDIKEFIFPENVTATSAYLCTEYRINDQYTIYSADNKVGTYLFDTISGEKTFMFDSFINRFAMYENFVCCGSYDDNKYSYIYDISEKKIVTKVYGQANFIFLDDKVLFDGSRYPTMYNFTTKEQLGKIINVIAYGLELPENKFLYMYSGVGTFLYDLKNFTLTTITPSFSYSNTTPWEYCEYNGKYLIAAYNKILSFDPLTNEIEEIISGTYIYEIKNLNGLIIYASRQHSNKGAIYELDVENKTSSVILGSLYNPRLTYVKNGNCLIQLTNSVNKLFISSTKEFVDLKQGTISAIYELNDSNVLVSMNYILNLNMNDGTFISTTSNQCIGTKIIKVADEKYLCYGNVNIRGYTTASGDICLFDENLESDVRYLSSSSYKFKETENIIHFYTTIFVSNNLDLECFVQLLEYTFNKNTNEFKLIRPIINYK